MHITLSPTRGLPGDPETVLAVSGDILTVDGVAYNLSAIPEGGEAIPEGADHPFVGTITRAGGTVHCTLRVHLGDDAAPDQPTSPWTTIVARGPVTIPALRRAAEPEESPV